MTETSAPLTELTAEAPAAEVAVSRKDREPASLRPPRHRIERRTILLWTIKALLGWAVLLGGLGLAYGLAEPARRWLEPPLVIGAVVAVLNVTLMPTWRYLVHRWEHTDQAVYLLKGWLIREWRVVPVSRIQSINTIRGPLQQLLGLATVKVTTASSEGGVQIGGLDAAVAARAARRLTEITQQTTGDAT